MIRPLLPADVVAGREVSWAALRDLDVRTGVPPMEFTPAMRLRSEARIAHLQATDPDRAWVAEEDGEVVGCALALGREGMWFLSLLMVDPAHQGKGIGAQLLAATLQTATDRSWILSTHDPRALRRYRRAGFDLDASFTAKGTVDRALIPAVPEVREGSATADAELLIRVTKAVRGASIEADLPFLVKTAPRVLVNEEGFAILRPNGLGMLAATNPQAARDLLWAALAEADGEVEIDWLAANQQWAIDVCLDARLDLVGGATLCFRGQPEMSPYLPSGALG